MKNLLITGHTGFIGSHLVNLLKKKFNVIGLSRNTQKNSDIIQIKGDIRKITVKKLPKKLDYIIHNAAMTDLVYSKNNPIECFDINFHGTQNMLEISRKLNTKFFFISTHHVYGKPETTPVKETSLLNHTSIYSGSKSAAEQIALSYSSSFNMDVSLLRLFSVYGPKSPEYLVTTKLISQLVNNSNFKAGNLFPKRDFIYIDDVVSAIKKIIDKSHGSNIYNIGTGKSHSILEVCNILNKIGNKKMKVKSVKSLSRKSDVLDIFANNEKLKKLGWKPKISITTGLKLTYDWYLSKSKFRSDELL